MQVCALFFSFDSMHRSQKKKGRKDKWLPSLILYYGRPGETPFLADVEESLFWTLGDPSTSESTQGRRLRLLTLHFAFSQILVLIQDPIVFRKPAQIFSSENTNLDLTRGGQDLTWSN